MDFPDPEDRLDSWKEIATFLGRTARTVQRWEKTAGLPVRRGGPGSRSGVVASRREVGEWWLRQRDKLIDDDPADPLVEPPRPGFPSEPPAASVRTRWPMSPLIASGCVVLTIAISAIVMAGRAEPGSTGSAIVPYAGRVSPLSTTEGRSIRMFAVPSLPGGLAVAPDGRRVFVSLPEEKAIAVIDVASGAVSARLPGIEGATALDVSRDGRLLVIAGAFEVGLIDLAAGALSTVNVGRFVRDVRLAGNGRRAWATLMQGGLRVIDTKTLTVTTVQTLGCPMWLAYGPVTERMYVSYQCNGPVGRDGHDAVEVFDEPRARSLIARAGPPLVGSHMTLSTDEQYLFADTHDACTSAKYDQQGCPAGRGVVVLTYRAETMEPVAVTRYPSDLIGSSLAFLPDNARLVMSADGIHIINAALGRIQESIAEAGTGPVVVDRSGERVYAIVRGNRVLELALGPREDARAIDGLVTYLTGDGAANDLVGGVYAVPADQPAYAPGRMGAAFFFDGARPGVSFGTRIDIDITDGPATYAAWIRPGERGTVLSRASFRGWRLWLAGGRPAFCFARAPSPLSCESGGLVAPAPLAAGAWHHLAVVRSSSDIQLFVNGERVAGASLSAYVPPPGRDYDEEPVMRLGAGRDGGARFDGLIDEFTMFRRDLGSAEIKRLMLLTSAEN